jgi:hypothetical protein
VQIQADDAAILSSLLLQYGVPLDHVVHSISGPIATALKLLGGSER